MCVCVCVCGGGATHALQRRRIEPPRELPHGALADVQQEPRTCGNPFAYRARVRPADAVPVPAAVDAVMHSPITAAAAAAGNVDGGGPATLGGRRRPGAEEGETREAVAVPAPTADARNAPRDREPLLLLLLRRRHRRWEHAHAVHCRNSRAAPPASTALANSDMHSPIALRTLMHSPIRHAAEQPRLQSRRRVVVCPAAAGRRARLVPRPAAPALAHSVMHSPIALRTLMHSPIARTAALARAAARAHAHAVPAVEVVEARGNV